jgi:uncharacterized membrane protein YhhN
MSKTLRFWSLVFWIIAGANLLAVLLTTLGVDGLRILDHATKWLLMPSLMLAWYFPSGSYMPKQRVLMSVALFFSWLGDVSLMFAGMANDKSQQLPLFLGGVAAFLVTHICYIIFFRREFKASGQPSILLKKPWAAAPILLLLFGLLYLVFPGLAKPLQVPVVIYACMLTVMVLSAVNRFGQVNFSSALTVYIGAQLFMLSDGMIAINHFYQPFHWAGFGIMVTYIAGQYFIVQGVLRAVDYSKKISAPNS